MARAPPLMVGAMFVLLVANVITLVCLTRLNIRYDQLAIDSELGLKERDSQLRVFKKQVDNAAASIGSCKQESRRAGTMGSTWLSIVAEGSDGKHDYSKQLNEIMTAILTESPSCSLPSTELHLFNGSMPEHMSALRTEGAFKTWEKMGRLHVHGDSGEKLLKGGNHTAQTRAALPKGSEKGYGKGTEPDTSDQRKTEAFAHALATMSGKCQHVLLLDLKAEPELCAGTLHLLRHIVARADSFFGPWSAIHTGGSVSGLILPCSGHEAGLLPLARYLHDSRKVATLQALILMWLSKDLAKFPILHSYQEHLPAGQPLYHRQALVSDRDTGGSAACGGSIQFAADGVVGVRGFDVDGCAHTDLSPCNEHFGATHLQVVGCPGCNSVAAVGHPATAAAATVSEHAVPAVSTKDTSGKDLHGEQNFAGLPAGYVMVAAMRGEDCSNACSATHRKCEAPMLDKVNNCNALEQAFGPECRSCHESEGADQPALDWGADECLVKHGGGGFTCEASHPKTRRLCVCGARS